MEAIGVVDAIVAFLGQALGPMVYGVALPVLGAPISFAGGAAILAATGLGANRLLR